MAISVGGYRDAEDDAQVGEDSFDNELELMLIAFLPMCPVFPRQ